MKGDTANIRMPLTIDTSLSRINFHQQPNSLPYIKTEDQLVVPLITSFSFLSIYSSQNQWYLATKL